MLRGDIFCEVVDFNGYSIMFMMLIMIVSSAVFVLAVQSFVEAYYQIDLMIAEVSLPSSAGDDVIDICT
jgi:hypothetical protein